MARYKTCEEFFESVKVDETRGETFLRITEAVQHGHFLDTKVIAEVYDEFFFMETNESDARNAANYLKQIIIHLFKIAYGNHQDGRSRLLSEIKEFRNQIIVLTNWDDPGRNDERTIGYLVGMMKRSYTRAINAIENILEEDPTGYSIDRKYLRKLPKECPWTLRQLMTGEPYVLAEVLPKSS